MPAMQVWIVYNMALRHDEYGFKGAIVVAENAEQAIEMTTLENSLEHDPTVRLEAHEVPMDEARVLNSIWRD